VDWKATNKMNCVSLELAHGPSDKPLMTKATVWRDLSGRLRSKLKKRQDGGGRSIAMQPAAECTRRVRTYKMANLRGLSVRTGKRKKQSMKQMAAPRLQAAKTSIRSHRLTIGDFG